MMRFKDIIDPSEIGRDHVGPSERKSNPRTIIAGPSISYSVQPNDTLNSIAARFDATPSELARINRLSTRFLFPGQVLVVPDKCGSKENITADSTDSDIYKDLKMSVSSVSDTMSVNSGKGNYPRTPVNSIDTDRSMDRECLERFLKIQVRHITDGQGVVAGVLLVTPNAVMFDPNVSDPLVIERGSESYGVIAPMDFVVCSALYFDIAHMKVKDTELPRPEIPKPEIYYGPSTNRLNCEDNPSTELLNVGEPGGGSQESPSKDISIGKDGTFLELTGSSQDNDNDSSCSCGGETRDTSAFPKAFEHELLTPVSTDECPLSDDHNVHQPVTHQSSGGLGDLTPIQEASRPEEQTSPVEESSTVTSTPPLLRATNDKKRTTSVTFSTSSESEMPPVPEDGADIPNQESRKQKVLKRLSYPLSWMDSFNTEKDAHGVGAQQGVPSSALPSAPIACAPAPGVTPGEEAKQQGMFSNVFSMSNVSNMLTRRPSLDFVRRPLSQPQSVPSDDEELTDNQQAQKRAQYKEGPKFGLKSMVSIEDMPDLFASFDKLIPKPATACDDPPLYLCLRMGTPIDKPIPKSTPIMTYGKKTMKPEYWFSIPRNRTDELYNFFQVWASEIYGDIDPEAIQKRGFILIDEEIPIWPSDKSSEGDGFESAAGELKEMTKESWEAASMSDELRRALYSSNSLTSLDIEVFLPEVQGTTEIIDDAFRKNMYRTLPARVQGYNWKLVFSTSHHGFSLKSLYRKMADIESPIILYIQDTSQCKFGVFLSCPLRVSELFYGTGESFMFACQPEFQIFSWTGENQFFVKGNNESLYIGGGDGNFGIWLDGDLYQGRTQPCKTFGNPILSGGEDFIVKTIECWHFD